MTTSKIHLPLPLFLALALVFAATAAAAPSADPVYPAIGDRGYDVSHYDAALSYDPGSGELDGTATIEGTAKANLSRFSLDLEGMEVTGVTVDGAPAQFGRRLGRHRFPRHEFGPPRFRFREGKLDVTAPRPIAAGQHLTAVVRYHGVPAQITTPSLSLANGWIRTDDGAIGISTGIGTPAWLPCNNIPADKASYTLHVSVPSDLVAASNGKLTGVAEAGGRKIFTWSESEPMSTYLAVVDIGRGTLEEVTIGGLPSWNFVDAGLGADVRRQLDRVPAVIEFESRIFGPYPFETAGSIVDVAKLGYAEETQGRPIYLSPAKPGSGPVVTTTPLPLVHEIAHQWFGDAVGISNWREIWLNEGFARWTEWFYTEKHGGQSAASRYKRLLHTELSPPADRVRLPRDVYAGGVYQRGAMALQALRQKVGTRTLLTILRQWVADHRYGSANTRQFVALAEKVSGRNLKPLFRQFLYRRHQ